MSVNEYQVGGTHYAQGGALQHWDFVELNGMGYLEGNATKYVTRWRSKNGVQDLEKAEHYIKKLIELNARHDGRVYQDWRRFNRKIFQYRAAVSVEDFAAANKLGPTETEICRLLLLWEHDGDLKRALELTRALMSEAA